MPRLFVKPNYQERKVSDRITYRNPVVLWDEPVIIKAGIIQIEPDPIS